MATPDDHDEPRSDDPGSDDPGSDEPRPDDTAPPEAPRGWGPTGWLGIALALGMAGWMWTWEPISRTESHTGRAILAIAAAGLAVIYVAWGLASHRRPTVARRMWRIAAVLCGIVGIGNYYTFNTEFAAGLGDYTDPSYYYLNSKYFDELGYFGIYEAVLLCDHEGPKRVAPKVRQVRNLRDYQIEHVRDALARAPEVKARFTSERWTAFCHDADFFVARKSVKSMTSNFFVDHGYNPPPPWTLVGKQISRVVPVEQVKVAAMVDVGVCLAMFGVVWWAFGADVMLLALLWWLCTMSGRWPVMGHAILRFDWVVALVLGMSALKRGHHALGGMALLWAALSRVFPAVFWCAAGLSYAVTAVKTRAVPREGLRFVLGSLAFGVVVAGLAFAEVGAEGFSGSLQNLRMHNDDPEAFSSQKIGLADAVFFRGETNRTEMRESPCGFVENTLAGVDCTIHGDAAKGPLLGNGIAGKGVLVHGFKPWLRLLGGLTILFMGLYTWRTRARPEHLVHLGALLVFILTTPSHYYWTMRILLVLFHAADLTKRRNQVGLLLLFAVEVVSNWAMTQGWEKYTVTATTSCALVVYFVWLGAAMALQAWRGERDSAAGDIRHG